MLYYSIVESIEKLAPSHLQASWDKSGLQVASTRKNINKMGVCLDATPETVEKAIDLGVDFLLAHHPLSLNPELPNKLNAWHRVLQLLLSDNIPLYSVHTSLDVNIEGPAGWLGKALKLEDAEILEPLSGNFSDFGYGQIGNLPHKSDFNLLSAHLMKLLNLTTIARCGLESREEIRRVAYCGGSASSMARLAHEKGADIFITGDVKYHVALESPVPILDVGHYSYELEMMRHVTRDLQKELPDLEIIFIPSPNPITYLPRIS